MLQYRFDFAARDLSAFAAQPQLSCTLGPVDTGPPEFARVGTNDRDWYKPETSTRHRGCTGDNGAWHVDVLIDVSRAALFTAYIAIGD